MSTTRMNNTASWSAQPQPAAKSNAHRHEGRASIDKTPLHPPPPSAMPCTFISHSWLPLRHGWASTHLFLSRGLPTRPFSRTHQVLHLLSKCEMSFSVWLGLSFYPHVSSSAPVWFTIFSSISPFLCSASVSLLQTQRPLRMRPPNLRYRWKTRKGPGSTKTRLAGEGPQVFHLNSGHELCF